MNKFILDNVRIKRFLRNQEGVISIFLLILIPIMILGSVFTYQLLMAKATENKAHKIAYACSEAYLSRNNKYLFDNFGIIATLDTEVLEKSIQYYFDKNQLIKDSQALNVNVQFFSLNKSDAFQEAAIDATSTVVMSELLNYSIGLLDQLEIADKIRSANRWLQNGEKKLSEQLDQSGATEILNRLSSCKNIIDGKEDVGILIKYLDKKHQSVFSSLEGLRSQVKEIKGLGTSSRFSTDDFIETKLEDWSIIEATFLETYNSYSKLASDVMDELTYLEKEQDKLNDILKELEALQILQTKPTNPELTIKIKRLQTESNMYSIRVSEGFELVEKMVDRAKSPYEDIRPNLIDQLANIAYEIETLISGIDIGEDQLIVKDSFGLNENESGSDVHDLNEQILLDEYFITIFSSYDKQCPRKFGYRERLNDKRLIKGEVEYLISGELVEKKSISNVRIRLFTIREAANLVTLISDSDKMRQIANATIALPQPWRTIASSAYIAAWSSFESYTDVNRLMKGEGFYFFKSKEQWASDLDTLFSEGWRTGVKSVKEAKLETIPESNEITTMKMFYLDYLRMLLLMQSESETLNRAMTLIACELDEISDGKTKLGDFSRGHMINLICNFGVALNSKETELRFDNEY